MSISKREFGIAANGQVITEYTVINTKGYGFSVIDYGACLTSIRVPDKMGKVRDVCLGFSDIERYEGDQNGSAGAVIGRVGGRIANASFTLEDKEYRLTANNGKNTLHSGNEGFDKRVWSAEAVDENTVRLELVSEDGDQGFPGQLQTAVSYSFTEENALRIKYEANTDKTTLCDITNHCYFNLNGHGQGDILGHELEIEEKHVLEVRTDLIPTGRLIPSEDLPFCFIRSAEIGDVIKESKMFEGIAYHKGIDINYCIGEHQGLSSIATLYSAESGIEMNVRTDQPSVHIYTGMCLDFPGKDGVIYRPYSGIAMLTEHYPDSVHFPTFPSYILRPEDCYETITEYIFSVRE